MNRDSHLIFESYKKRVLLKEQAGAIVAGFTGIGAFVSALAATGIGASVVSKVSDVFNNITPKVGNKSDPNVFEDFNYLLSSIDDAFTSEKFGAMLTLTTTLVSEVAKSNDENLIKISSIINNFYTKLNESVRSGEISDDILDLEESTFTTVNQLLIAYASQEIAKISSSQLEDTRKQKIISLFNSIVNELNVNYKKAVARKPALRRSAPRRPSTGGGGGKLPEDPNKGKILSVWLEFVGKYLLHWKSPFIALSLFTVYRIIGYVSGAEEFIEAKFKKNKETGKNAARAVEDAVEDAIGTSQDDDLEIPASSMNSMKFVK
jgi:hypothetical protein